MTPSPYLAHAGRRIVRRASPAAIVALLLLGVALAACGTPPPLDQAIKCDQFKRSPDGGWTATTDVLLDYEANGVHNQTNLSKGVAIRPGNGQSYADIVAALEKKCRPAAH